jgi:hypothetical protein
MSKKQEPAPNAGDILCCQSGICTQKPVAKCCGHFRCARCHRGHTKREHGGIFQDNTATWPLADSRKETLLQDNRRMMAAQAELRSNPGAQRFLSEHMPTMYNLLLGARAYEEPSTVASATDASIVSREQLEALAKQAFAPESYQWRLPVCEGDAANVKRRLVEMLGQLGQFVTDYNIAGFSMPFPQTSDGSDTQATMSFECNMRPLPPHIHCILALHGCIYVAIQDPSVAATPAPNATVETLAVMVTDMHYPSIFKAFRILDHDNGAVNRNEPERTYYQVPFKFAQDLADCENALAQLSPFDMDMFCTGEDSEVQTILQRKTSSKNLLKAYALVSAYFNGWNE